MCDIMFSTYMTRIFSLKNIFKNIKFKLLVRQIKPEQYFQRFYVFIVSFLFQPFLPESCRLVYDGVAKKYSYSVVLTQISVLPSRIFAKERVHNGNICRQ